MDQVFFVRLRHTANAQGAGDTRRIHPRNAPARSYQHVPSRGQSATNAMLPSLCSIRFSGIGAPHSGQGCGGGSC